MILSLNYNVNNPSFIKLSKVIREPLKRPKKVLERHPKLYIYIHMLRAKTVEYPPTQIPHFSALQIMKIAP